MLFQYTCNTLEQLNGVQRLDAMVAAAEDSGLELLHQSLPTPTDTIEESYGSRAVATTTALKVSSMGTGTIQHTSRSASFGARMSGILDGL